MPKDISNTDNSGPWRGDSHGERGRGDGNGGKERQIICDIAVSTYCLLHTNPYYYCEIKKILHTCIFAEMGLPLQLVVGQQPPPLHKCTRWRGGSREGTSMQAPTHPPVELPAEEQVGEEAMANNEVEQILHFDSDEDM